MNPASRQSRSSSIRVLDFTLEALKLFGIAIAALLLLTVAVFVSAKTGIVVPKRWFGLCVWTGVLIWVVYRICKHHRRKTKFWLVFGGLFMVHVLAFIVVLRSVTDWRLGWFMPIFLVEAPAVVMVIEAVLSEKPSRTLSIP